MTTNGESDSEKNEDKSGSEVKYPAYGLGAAIGIMEAVRRAGGNDAAVADVMREMGVTKNDRIWNYGVPAARYFGLVARVGRGDAARLKVTDLASRIAKPLNDGEARAAKVAAFRTPDLYSRLMEKFAGHPVPSKEGLRNILEREFGIMASMTGYAADAFLESLKTAELIGPGGAILAPNEAVAPDAQKSLPPGEATASAAQQIADPPPGMQSIFVPREFVIYRCKIGGGRVIEIPLPPKFTKRDVDRLHAFLQTQIDDEPEESEGGTA